MVAMETGGIDIVLTPLLINQVSSLSVIVSFVTCQICFHADVINTVFSDRLWLRLPLTNSYSNFLKKTKTHPTLEQYDDETQKYFPSPSCLLDFAALWKMGDLKYMLLWPEKTFLAHCIMGRVRVGCSMWLTEILNLIFYAAALQLTVLNLNSLCVTLWRLTHQSFTFITFPKLF